MQSCGIEKAFLFDVVSKIYIATDSNPVDVQSYELCSDMIDVVIDVSCIYGMKDEGEGYAYDDKSASMIRLTGGEFNGRVLYLREVSRCVEWVPWRCVFCPHPNVCLPQLSCTRVFIEGGEFREAWLD